MVAHVVVVVLAVGYVYALPSDDNALPVQTAHPTLSPVPDRVTVGPVKLDSVDSALPPPVLPKNSSANNLLSTSSVSSTVVTSENAPTLHDLNPQVLAENSRRSEDGSNLSVRDGLAPPHDLSLPITLPKVPELMQLTKKSCTVPGLCEPIRPTNIYCFDTNLNYRQSSLTLSGLASLAQVESALKEWSTLKMVPSCWKVIQPVLCGIYFPSCTNNTVHLVPTDLCKVVKSSCRNVISQLNPHWEKILDCDSFRYSDCKKDEKSERLRFNTSSLCPSPLVPTQDNEYFFGDYEECGMSCISPLLTLDQHDRIRTLIAVAGTISLVCTLFAVTTFLIDWNAANKYPAVAIFYINLCCFFSTVGWMAQLGGKEDIVCRKEGLLRRQEPGSGDNLACVFVYILIYYFSIGAGVWLVILTYTWSVFFTHNTKVKDMIEPWTAYFHLSAWSLPAVLTIVILGINQVEASSLYGVCFIGFETISTRIVFLITPFSLFIMASGYFSVRCLKFLSGVYLTPDFLSSKESAKVQSTLLRIGVFLVLTVVVFLGSLLCQVYEMLHRPGWTNSLKNLVICNLKQQLIGGSISGCSLEDKPNPAILQLHLLCIFGGSILSSSWVFTKESLSCWRIFLSQLLFKKSQRPVKLKKHQMIAQAFSKRREIQDHGRLSLTLQSAHPDPVGIHVELGDESSGEVSSTWAAALPYLVQRRGAICGVEQLGLGRMNLWESGNSSVSQSVSVMSTRFGWLDSRQQSVDSQQSIQISDLDRLQRIYDKSIKKSKRKRQRAFFNEHAKKMRPWSRFSRRGSMSSRRDSSVSKYDSSFSRNSDTSINSQILPAITLDPVKLRNKHRRSEYSLPVPGKSTDFGKTNLANVPPSDPTYRALEEKLTEISRTSHQTDRECETIKSLGNTEVMRKDEPTERKDDISTTCRAIQTSLTDLSGLGQRRPTMVTVGTSMTPQLSRAITPSASSSAKTTFDVERGTMTTALQHVEANVVSIKVVGPSSEESSIPSSYEKDMRMKKLSSSRGKENIQIPSQSQAHANHGGDSIVQHLNEIEIPALKQLTKAPIIRPKDHYRGRRGAIVEKLSPKGVESKGGQGDTTTDTATTSS